MFKRLLAAMMALTLIVGMTVVSYAYASPPDVPTWYVKDGETYIGTLKTESLSTVVKDFLKEWLDSPDAGFFYCSYLDVYHFVIFNPGYKGAVNFAMGGVNPQLGSVSGKSYTFREFNFIGATGVPIGVNVTTNTVSSGGGIMAGYVVRGWYRADLGNFSDNLIIDYTGGLGFVDDGGIFASTLPTPPDPEEPSSSTPPPTPSVPSVPFPEVKPSDSEWVVYDATKWNQFADQVKQSIGSSTNVGLLIFATILSLYLIHRIVRKFAD